MLPIISIPNIQTLPPIQTESLAGVPTQTSLSGRIPFDAVPANGETISVQQDQRSAAARLPRVSTFGTLSGSSTLSPSGFTASGLPVSPGGAFTSLFMAQVIGQGGAANDNDLMASFFSYTPPASLAPDQALMERFSLTKYLPSNAAKPLPQPQGTARLTAPPPEQRDVPVVARQATLSAPAPQPQVTYSQLPATGLTVHRPPEIRGSAERGPERESSQIRLGNSLIRKSGFPAYIATFSRNVANIDQDPENKPLRIAS